MKISEWNELKKMIIRLIIPLAIAYILIIIIIGVIV
jgi:hypothetical protein